MKPLLTRHCGIIDTAAPLLDGVEELPRKLRGVERPLGERGAPRRLHQQIRVQRIRRARLRGGALVSSFIYNTATFTRRRRRGVYNRRAAAFYSSVVYTVHVRSPPV